MPALPFLSLSLVHLWADRDGYTGMVIATLLLAFAGMMLAITLQPIARIASMFNSSLAFKSEPPPAGTAIWKPGTLSIVAVARSMAQDDQQYAIFLEYVQGGDFQLVIGLPGFYVVPINNGTIASMLETFVFKLPLFVSLLL